MVLTIQSTPLDGAAEAEPTTEDTINDVPEGQPEDLPSPPEPTEFSQLTATPTPEPTTEAQQETAVQPDTRQTQRAEVLPEQAAPDPEPEVAVNEAPLSEAEAATESGEDIQVELEPVEQSSPLPVLTTAFNPLTTLTYQPIPELPATEKVSVTEAQQKMLDKKLKQWASDIDELDAQSESVTWHDGGQVYVAKFSREPASSDMDMDEVRVEVVTEQDGQRLTTEMRMKKLAFSNFAQFVHRWDPNVRVHDDEMDGRFHSNAKINLEYSRYARPVFHGKVTTASYGIQVERRGKFVSRKNVFRGGLETGVKRILMPKPRLLFPDEAPQDDENTFYFDDDARIIFLPDGRYVWHHLNDNIPMQARVIGDQPIYLVSAPGKKLYVSGRVRGKVLVYSPVRIVIEDDLIYENSDEIYDGDDFLGLVSGRDIVIADHQVTGPGDLEINGSIYARGRFVVRDYLVKNGGILHLFGSLSVGYLTATEPRYATRIVFDKRLEDIRPPRFPVTDRYELASSNAEWTSEPLPQEPPRTESAEISTASEAQ